MARNFEGVFSWSLMLLKAPGRRPFGTPGTADMDSNTICSAYKLVLRGKGMVSKFGVIRTCKLGVSSVFAKVLFLTTLCQGWRYLIKPTSLELHLQGPFQRLFPLSNHAAARSKVFKVFSPAQSPKWPTPILSGLAWPGLVLEGCRWWCPPRPSTRGWRRRSPWASSVLRQTFSSRIWLFSLLSGIWTSKQ